MRTNIHPDEALKLVLEAGISASYGLSTERVPLGAALGRLLITSVISPIDHPPFDKSAMDGFAVSGKAPDDEYEIVDSVPAGKKSFGTPGIGQAARIMTGAPVPLGTSFVQRLEWTAEAGTSRRGLPLIRFTRQESTTNVIRRGENLSSGSEMLGPRMLKPQDIGILASAGIGEVEVARRPRVAVISTGDELQPAGARLDDTSIYDSNGPQLAAQCLQAGAEPEFFGIVKDETNALRTMLARALRDFDLVLVSGAVSLGDFDFVPSTLESLGVRAGFHGIAMRPGKPTYFGTLGTTAVFGLPGNPVSTFVNFEVFVRPYLMARAGLIYSPDIVRARMGSRLVRRGSDRVEFLPATLHTEAAGMVVRPLTYHGSSMVTVLAQADCLIRMEIGVEMLSEGELVDARRIRA